LIHATRLADQCFIAVGGGGAKVFYTPIHDFEKIEVGRRRKRYRENGAAR
jgi:hypothetical protein